MAAQLAVSTRLEDSDAHNNAHLVTCTSEEDVWMSMNVTLLLAALAKSATTSADHSSATAERKLPVVF